ncbi:helix-turn-helix transcriptional regulator [Marinobacterium jannaschii]|uniref:helix-turn-helix transcriptional regulator n=1 Tax=Marinobacterium jannaschii TaxID=64970 RepID=UPI0004841C04|nr:metalloregulator ArsR/SmtB family transcription factor [Marinobacterium jannaschii]
MSNADQILQLLKTRGPLTAAELGESLAITSMGARRHLQALENEGLVYWQESAASRGRPKHRWYLTSSAMQRFPDSHAELSLQLIESVIDLFGEEGLDKLISRREQQQSQRYRQALADKQDISERLHTLASLRSEEGYMAETIECEDGSFLLQEHHCPICAAATQCQGFCRSELALFRQLLAGQASIEREQYLLDGDLRCSYRIKPL